MEIPDQPNREYWAISSARYMKEVIKNIELHLQKQGRKLRKSQQPMLSNYHPEIDISPYLAPEEIHFYQSQISILCWIDILTPVALLSSYLTHPRQGQLEAILKSHDCSTMVFDPSYVTWQDTVFPLYDWSDFYSNVTEEIPSNAPLPRGRYVQINAFADANHAGNKLTHRSHTGILIYLNRAPIIWYSKAQKTIELSTFG
jgi:hypothetical protein